MNRSGRTYFVEQSFEQTKANPFTDNQPYTDEWIMLQLLESAGFSQFTGGGVDGVFRLVLTKANVDWEYMVFDFIQYESDIGKNIILAIDKQDYETARKTYGGHGYKDRFLRPYEHRVLMHSTDKESHATILRDGCLKSWNSLKRLAAMVEKRPIGSLLGDPPDYSDYIMFSNGGISVERVVSSRQKGRVEMDIDVPYVAGARFYFDALRVAEEGLLVRDGVHLKVRDELPLEKYLLWIATPDALGILEETTPRIFAEKADKVFEEKFGIVLNRDTGPRTGLTKQGNEERK